MQWHSVLNSFCGVRIGTAQQKSLKDQLLGTWILGEGRQRGSRWYKDESLGRESEGNLHVRRLRPL